MNDELKKMRFGNVKPEDVYEREILPEILENWRVIGFRNVVEYDHYIDCNARLVHQFTLQSAGFWYVEFDPISKLATGPRFIVEKRTTFTPPPKISFRLTMEDLYKTPEQEFLSKLKGDGYKFIRFGIPNAEDLSNARFYVTLDVSLSEKVYAYNLIQANQEYPIPVAIVSLPFTFNSEDSRMVDIFFRKLGYINVNNKNDVRLVMKRIKELLDDES